MGDFYSDLVVYIKEVVKATPKGAEMPDEVCDSIAWNFIYESVRDRYFFTEKFARWFEGEFELMPDQIEGILSRMREMATEVGFEVVMPGDAPPDETPPEQAAEGDQDFAQVADDPSEAPAEETQNYVSIGQTITDDEAADLLNTVVTGAVGIEPVVAQVLRDKVVSTEYLVSLFLPGGAAKNYEAPAIKQALCLHAEMEIDHMHYTGAKKVAGFSLSNAVNYTKQLLARYENVKKDLDNVKTRLESEKRIDAVGEIESLKNRMNNIAAELQNLVATFSEVATEAASQPASSQSSPVEKKLEMTASPKPKAAVAAAKATKKEAETKKKKQNTIKMAIAFVVIVAIVVGVGFFLYRLLVPAPLPVFDASKYASILVLKEAKQSGTSFSAVVPSSEWDKLTPDEKMDRAVRLLRIAKGDLIDSIVLLDDQGNLLVQTYGGKPKIIK